MNIRKKIFYMTLLCILCRFVISCKEYDDSGNLIYGFAYNYIQMDSSDPTVHMMPIYLMRLWICHQTLLFWNERTCCRWTIGKTYLQKLYMMLYMLTPILSSVASNRDIRKINLF